MINLPLVFKLKILITKNPVRIKSDVSFMDCRYCPILRLCANEISGRRIIIALSNGLIDRENKKYRGCLKYYDALRKEIAEEFKSGK